MRDQSRTDLFLRRPDRRLGGTTGPAALGVRWGGIFKWTLTLPSPANGRGRGHRKMRTMKPRDRALRPAAAMRVTQAAL
jgi:hypothetical protein